MNTMLKSTILSASLTITALPAALACSLADGYAEGSAPAIDERRLIAHTETVRINASLEHTLEIIEGMDLQDSIIENGDSDLPGVIATRELTEGGFYGPGSRRLVCLSDGGTVLEEVLERDRAADTSRFRYVVWGYTSDAARAVDYAVGDFQFVEQDGTTEIVWTYAFVLKSDRFPGNLGWLGARLFRWSFLERDYAEMMRGTLESYRRAIEG